MLSRRFSAVFAAKSAARKAPLRALPIAAELPPIIAHPHKAFFSIR